MHKDIILLESIKMFCGTDNVLRNIPHIQIQFHNNVVWD